MVDMEPADKKVCAHLLQLVLELLLQLSDAAVHASQGSSTISGMSKRL